MPFATVVFQIGRCTFFDGLFCCYCWSWKFEQWNNMMLMSLCHWLWLFGVWARMLGRKLWGRGVHIENSNGCATWVKQRGVCQLLVVIETVGKMQNPALGFTGSLLLHFRLDFHSFVWHQSSTTSSLVGVETGQADYSVKTATASIPSPLLFGCLTLGHSLNSRSVSWSEGTYHTKSKHCVVAVDSCG